jgi:hypothetical protein
MTLTQAITTACGVFAPGHLGALTRFVPFELVDDVLDRPGRRGRIRSVPPRVAVYFVLALALFPESSYGRVWDTLVGAVRQAGHAVAAVTEAGLADLRRVMALVETGTRALLGAVIGPIRGEVDAALELLHHLSAGMLVLADRGFDANAFIRAIHRSRAALLLRVCSTRKPTVLRVLHDGSYLSVIAGVPVRVIAATVTVTCADGSSHTSRYRLVTTLTDAQCLQVKAVGRLSSGLTDL